MVPEHRGRSLSVALCAVTKGARSRSVTFITGGGEFTDHLRAPFVVRWRASSPANAQIPQGSNVSSCQGHAVSPGEVFVVVGAVFEAAVEDPDEAVSQGS